MFVVFRILSGRISGAAVWNVAEANSAKSNFTPKKEQNGRHLILAMEIDKYPPDDVDDGNYSTDATFMDWPMSGMRDPPSIGHPTADGGHFFSSFQTIALGH